MSLENLHVIWQSRNNNLQKMHTSRQMHIRIWQRKNTLVQKQTASCIRYHHIYIYIYNLTLTVSNDMCVEVVSMWRSICLHLFLWHAYLAALSTHSCWVIFSWSTAPLILPLHTLSFKPLRLIWRLMNWSVWALEPPIGSRDSHFSGYNLCSGCHGIRGNPFDENRFKMTAEGWESAWILN